MLFPMSLIAERVLDLPKLWTNHKLLPAYFMTLEKHFANRNMLHRNARFVALSNVMSPIQIEKHNLLLFKTAENEQPYTTLKI